MHRGRTPWTLGAATAAILFAAAGCTVGEDVFVLPGSASVEDGPTVVPAQSEEEVAQRGGRCELPKAEGELERAGGRYRGEWGPVRSGCIVAKLSMVFGLSSGHPLTYGATLCNACDDTLELEYVAQPFFESAVYLHTSTPPWMAFTREASSTSSTFVWGCAVFGPFEWDSSVYAGASTSIELRPGDSVSLEATTTASIAWHGHQHDSSTSYWSDPLDYEESMRMLLVLPSPSLEGARAPVSFREACVVSGNAYSPGPYEPSGTWPEHFSVFDFGELELPFEVLGAMRSN